MTKKKEKPDLTYKHIAALSEISKAITSELYLDDVLKLIVTVTAQTTGSKLCSLMLLDEKTQQLQIRATQSVSEDYIRKPPLRVGEGVSGKVVLTKEPIAIYDVQKHPDFKYKEIAKKEGISSLLCVPLCVKGKCIGVINLYSSKLHKFTKSEIELLTAVANQAAMVIENTELMVKTRVIQEELETRKLVERAKGILMREQKLSEEEAYRKIQRFSMDSRKSMRQVAEAIITSNEIRNINSKEQV